MTIYRHHFEDGYSIDLQADLNAQLVNAIIDHPRNGEALPAGDYHLTPGWWKRHLHEHYLRVLPTGEGTYQTVPRDNDVGIIDLPGGTFHPGGWRIRLPQDVKIVPLIGPRPDRQTKS